MLDDLIFAVPQKSIDSSSVASVRLKKKIASARELCKAKKAIWNAYWVCYGRGATGEAFTPIADSSEVKKLWLQQVPRHLPGYVKYRAATTTKFFGTTGLDLAAPDGAKDFDAPQEHPLLYGWLKHYVVDFALANFRFIFLGWTALLVSAVGLVLSLKRRTRCLRAAAFFASGVLYLLTFVPTAPATDYRYTFWTVLAALLGWVVFAAEMRFRHRRSKSAGRASSQRRFTAH